MSLKMWAVNILLGAFFVLSIGIAKAEGDKVREANVVFGDDGEPVGIIVPVDCTKAFSPQSGAVVYFCVVEGE